MAFALLPMVVYIFFMGLVTSEYNRSQDSLPPATTIKSDQNALMFIAYVNAVTNYQKLNPTFLGAAPISYSAIEHFSSAFLASAGNAITATASGTGRVITVYAALPPGSVTQVLSYLNNDPSIGVTNGTTWTSYAQGQGISNVPVLLATPVPNGDVVSVVQLDI